jgi:hypothetical protein
MHICEFCSATFQARPQVKRSRQRANEKAWHSKHKGEFDRRYHQVLKKLRSKQILNVCRELLNNLKVGCAFHGRALNLELVESHLFRFLSNLGIRRVNKFWVVL